MKIGYRALAALALVALAAAAVALVAGKVTPGTSSAREGGDRQGGMAFKKHTEDLLSRAGTAEGPATYADQVAELNAYPGTGVTADQLAGARASFAAIKGHGYGRGKHSTTSWYSLGPNTAVYPAFLNRHGSEYVTSGRITALEIAPDCNASRCTVWVGAAGGGIWKTDKALAGNPNWRNVSDGFFSTGAIGSLTYDAKHNTLYAGTGELAAASDAEAGRGIYKSTDGGETWTALGGNANFENRSIRQIAVDPYDPTGKTIWAADGRGVRGLSGTNAGAVSVVPGAPPWGLYKSTDGGATFALVAPAANGLAPLNPPISTLGSPRGFTDVVFDPTHAGVIYATSYGQGVFRSTDNGVGWTLLQACTSGCSNADRSELAVTTTPDGHTRMYMSQGDTCDPDQSACTNPVQYSKFYVANAVESGSPTFVNKTSTNPADAGYATFNFCTAQCWYDQGVYSPAGSPNIVYVFGSYYYREAGRISNARALLLSRDGGETFTDLTEDATSATAPNGLHPDQHALVTIPGKPLQFLEGSDGGLMMSDGTLVDTSSRCDSRPLGPVSMARCKQLLSAVPGTLTSLNRGLQTLQFQSLSVNPFDAKDVQGGTQDNGTFESYGSVKTWPQTIFGDGGLSGFDVADPHFRFHTYFSQQVDVSYEDGAPPSWDWIADPLFSIAGDGSLFYIPIINDPLVSGTMFAGTHFAWRTLDNGGPKADVTAHCNEFTYDATIVCGDWEVMSPGSLTRASLGTRSGGSVSWFGRSKADASTLWASTSTGRLFVSSNANAVPASSVSFNRIDTAATPNRAISSIFVDPANANHAWVSYLGFNTTVPASAPGHVFEVTYDPATHSATFTRVDDTAASPIGDQPVNAVAFDAKTGDLYAATDYGVTELAADDAASGWVLAAQGLPIVTISGLTLNPDGRQLLAATHGRGAYQLTLP